MNQMTKVNLDYYDQLYRHKNPILHLLHARVSFDQQSKSRANHAAIDPLLKRLAKEKDSVKVLDYGSGWGVFLLNMPKVAVEAYCFDISANAVRSLRSAMRLYGRSVKEANFDEKNNICPDGFDLIVCSHVLEHVEADQTLLRQLVQALRPGGYLLVNVPINEVWSDPKHIRSYDSKILENLMTSTGLKILGQCQADKWTGYLLKHEVAYKSHFLVRLALRALRGLLTLLPQALVRLSEDIFLSNYHPQQLIMLGSKR